MHKSKVYFIFFSLAVLLLLPCTSRAQVKLFTANDPYCDDALVPPICLNPFLTSFEVYLVYPGLPAPILPSEVGRQIAAAFVIPYHLTETPSGLFALTRIDYAFENFNQPHYVQLAADAGGLPGTILETWPAGSAGTILKTVFDSSGNTILKAGQQYWVIISRRNSDQPGWWYANNDGVNPEAFGPVAYSDASFNYTLFPQPSPLPSFTVWGDAVDVVNPPGGVGLAQRLHLVAGPVNPAPGGPVQLALGFTDLNGNPVGPTLTTQPLSAGQTASLDLNADTLISRLGDRIEVRPTVKTVQLPGAPPVSTALTITWEIRDNLTGIGTVLTSALMAAPGNGPPTFVLQGLAGGEIMRLNVSAYTTNNPCIAVLSFADNNGIPVGPSMPVNLNPGMSSSLDLNSSVLGLAIGQVTNVQPIVTLTSPITAGPPVQSVCAASSEVFDRLTGRTHTYQAGSTTRLPAVQ